MVYDERIRGTRLPRNVKNSAQQSAPKSEPLSTLAERSCSSISISVDVYWQQPTSPTCLCSRPNPPSDVVTRSSGQNPVSRGFQLQHLALPWLELACTFRYSHGIFRIFLINSPDFCGSVADCLACSSKSQGDGRDARVIGSLRFRGCMIGKYLRYM